MLKNHDQGYSDKSLKGGWTHQRRKNGLILLQVPRIHTCWAKTHTLYFFSRVNPATYVNLGGASWAPSSHLPFIGQRNLLASSSGWLQSVSQKSCERLSLLRGHKKRKACSAVSAIKTKDMKPVCSKWEIPSSGFEKDVNITKGRSPQAEEFNQQTSMWIAPNPTQTNDEQPNKNEGQPIFYLKFQRQK